MAFFNPHSTGRHTFYVSNDDGAQLWLGDGRNLTAAYQNRWELVYLIMLQYTVKEGTAEAGY